MLRKIGTAAAVLAVAGSAVLLTANPALASNFARERCTGLFVEYEVRGDKRFVKYLEATNLCDPYHGHHQITGLTDSSDVDRDPITSYRVTHNQEVKAGYWTHAIGWKKVGSGWENVGYPTVVIG